MGGCRWRWRGLESEDAEKEEVRKGMREEEERPIGLGLEMGAKEWSEDR